MYQFTSSNCLSDYFKLKPSLYLMLICNRYHPHNILFNRYIQLTFSDSFMRDNTFVVLAFDVAASLARKERRQSNAMPRPLFTKRSDVLPQDLSKSRSRDIRVWAFPIDLKFDRHLAISAVMMPVKFQSDTIIITSNLVAVRFCYKTSYRLVNRGPEVRLLKHRSLIPL